MIATFDDRDAEIVATRLAALNENPDPRVGDFVIFTDGVTRRISYVWEAWEDMPASVQTSDGGSFHLAEGFVSFSGRLHPGIPADTLAPTDELRDGSVWIFHHDRWMAHNGVDTVIPFRVYSCTLAGAK